MTVEMKKYKLGDIAKIYDGPHATPKKIDQGPIYLGINAVTEDCRIDPNGLAFLSEGDYKVWTKRVTPQHKDIVFSYEATLGRYAIIPENFYGCLGRRLGIVRVVDAKVNYEWLFYYFQSPQWKSFIKNHTIKGSTVDRISVEEMPNYEIPAIDISKQNRIALVLSTLDKRIENLRAQNRVLEQTAKTIYDYNFLQCAGHQTTYNKTLNRNIPVGWEVKSVREFAELITKGTTPTTLGFNFEENGVNFVKVECIENGRLITENLAHISKEAHEKLKRSNLHENDILVTIAGRLASPCVVPKSVLPANTNQAVGIIRLTKENQKYVQYVFYCIFDPAMQNKLKGINAQSIQKNLTLPNLGNIPIAVPDDKTLEEFNSQVIPIFRKQQVNLLQIETLTTQRNTLLPLLMTGQVEV